MVQVNGSEAAIKQTTMRLKLMLQNLETMRIRFQDRIFLLESLSDRILSDIDHEFLLMLLQRVERAVEEPSNVIEGKYLAFRIVGKEYERLREREQQGGAGLGASQPHET